MTLNSKPVRFYTHQYIIKPESIYYFLIMM